MKGQIGEMSKENHQKKMNKTAECRQTHLVSQREMGIAEEMTQVTSTMEKLLGISFLICIRKGGKILMKVSNALHC